MHVRVDEAGIQGGVCPSTIAADSGASTSPMVLMRPSSKRMPTGPYAVSPSKTREPVIRMDWGLVNSVGSSTAGRRRRAWVGFIQGDGDVEPQAVVAGV